MERRLGNALGLFTIISLVLYSFFFSTERQEFSSLFITYSLLFITFATICYVINRCYKDDLRILPRFMGKWFYDKPIIGAIFLIGLILRLSLIDDTPHLSQDFFRFIWDGHMLINGYNPYLYLPDDIIHTGADFIPNAQFLHTHMGALSSGHYTNYPPLNQLFFAVASFLGGDSILATVVWMRLLIIMSSIGIFIYGIRLLQLLGKPLWLISLYYLNPFVIIELTGNLHWESMMAFFMLVAVYYLVKYNWVKSAVFLAYGILLKLLPVITLPLLYRRLKLKKAIGYYTIVAAVVILGFMPFISQVLLDNYSESVGLWFGDFEFNASIYYLIRTIGYKFIGYNIIDTVGKILPAVTLIIILLIALIRKNEYTVILLSSIVLSFFIYLLLSTTVHPWYLTIPLLFSIFTRYRFMLVWSFMAFLSYHAYSNEFYTENLWIIAFEYAVVITVFVVDTLSRKRNNNHLIRN